MHFFAVFLFNAEKKQGVRFVLMLLLLFLMLTIVNPLFNPRGNTVLFEYFNARAFTLEALLYGASTAAMLVSAFLWFACLNEIMSADKYMYVFSEMFSSVTLIFTMALRLVPLYKNKIKQIVQARRCIGMFPSMSKGATKKDLVAKACTVLSCLVSWAFENAITTADSMKSRGFSSCRRTHFNIYRFDTQSIIFMVYETLLTAVVLIGAVSGATYASFIPSMSFAQLDKTVYIIGFAAYIMLLAAPSFLSVKEIVVWRYLRSKI